MMGPSLWLLARSWVVPRAGHVVAGSRRAPAALRRRTNVVDSGGLERCDGGGLQLQPLAHPISLTVKLFRDDNEATEALSRSAPQDAACPWWHDLCSATAVFGPVAR